MREIINHDIKKIQKLSLKILKDDQFQSIERLGGMTNHSYHVRTAKHDLVFRLPGDGTEGIINRENEIKDHLAGIMPEYCSRILQAKEYIERL